MTCAAQQMAIARRLNSNCFYDITVLFSMPSMSTTLRQPTINDLVSRDDIPAGIVNLTFTQSTKLHELLRMKRSSPLTKQLRIPIDPAMPDPELDPTSTRIALTLLESCRVEAQTLVLSAERSLATTISAHPPTGACAKDRIFNFTETPEPLIS